MGLYIKGLDLPNGPIKLVLYPSGKVDEYVLNERIATDYQAIQIDRPHGRLIDGDDIYIGRWDIDTDLAEQIQNAPTILEAETGE